MSAGTPSADAAPAGVAALFAEQRETYLLGLIRIAFGVLLILHARRLRQHERSDESKRKHGT